MEEGKFRSFAMLEMEAVYRFAYHLLPKSPQEIGDLVQETYLQAFKSATQFTLTSQGMRPWLFKILHNLVRKQFALQMRQPSLLGDADVPCSGASSESSAWGEGSEVDWDNVDERLKTAIAELPLAYRTVFLLWAVENLKYREIAEVVGIPVGTVMSRLCRARATLSCQLADLAVEEGLGR